jgi:rare lipoprotein A (peptidoglycan hydrolase)
MILAVALSVCLPGPSDTDKGWASWYASPMKSHHTYNNPWYSRGRNPVKNYAAVKSFTWGDAPYAIQVCSHKTGKCAIAIVVDRCQGCTGKRLVDLSPRLFKALGIPLEWGVMKITMRRMYGDQGSSDRCPTAR